MLVNPKESFDNKLHQSVVFRPMLWAYTICTEMSGNGVQMIGMTTIKAHQLMEVLGDRELVV